MDRTCGHHLFPIMCFCNVTCTTDYSEHLECACSGVSPPISVLIEATCSGEYDGEPKEVHGRCEVNPPRSSCLMHPEDFSEILSYETECTVVVRDPPTAQAIDSASLKLGDIVKTLPPYNVSMTRDTEGVNITWDINNYMDILLRYSVRLTDTTDPTKVRIFEENNQYFLIDFSNLLPNTRYQVDVQASLSPKNGLYLGPWSAWSPSVDIMKGGETDLVWYVFIAAPLCVMGLCCFLNPFCLKKVQLITFIPDIPDPTPFFKPLHHKYEGNFKDWVHPMFSEAEVLMVAPKPVPLSDQKLLLLSQHGKQPTERWVQREEEEEEGDDENQEGQEGEPVDVVRDALHPDGPSFPGHLSLHMVVLSGVERDERAPELHGGGGAGPVEAEGVAMVGGEVGLLAYGAGEGGLWFGVNPDPDPDPDLDLDLDPAPGRVLLASYKWTEPWDDDYPRVDLDTVDSGFGESDCSSPVCSEAASEEEPGGAGFFTSDGGVYVRQWT
ncbi:unnamed protein product [Merluccius merluccius]